MNGKDKPLQHQAVASKPLVAVYHSECWHPVHIIHIHSVANAAGLQLPAAQARGTWVALRKRKLQRLHEAYSVIVNIYRERERERH